VTGGAGFIGSHVVEALTSAGHEVRVLDALLPCVHPGGIPPFSGDPGFDFVHGDVGTYRTDVSYDAVIGRHILIHTPDPRVVVGLAHSLLTPGGVAVFQEYDFSVVHRPFAEAPLYERLLEVFRAFFAKAGHGNIGTRLFQLLIEAGFRPPECRVEYPMDGGADSPFYEWVAESFRSILPRAAALGLVGGDEVAGIDSLARRLKEETISHGGCVPGPAMVGCFARKR